MGPFTWYFGGIGPGAGEGGNREALCGKTPESALRRHHDFREMLEKEKSIDAALIATPDYLHAYASCWRCGRGSTWTARSRSPTTSVKRVTSRKLRWRSKVATQMGNHGRSSEGHRLTV